MDPMVYKQGQRHLKALDGLAATKRQAQVSRELVELVLCSEDEYHFSQHVDVVLAEEWKEIVAKAHEVLRLAGKEGK